MPRSLAALALAVSTTALAAPGPFLPPNNLDLEDCLACEDVSMTQAQFNGIIENVAFFYRPVVAAKGASLQMNKLWTNTTVNANASQAGSVWTVNMYGGLARRQEITADGFALVVCHELGHHLGGFPKYDADSDWAATEGQADYFATQACARQVWKGDAALNATFRSQVGSIGKAACDRTFKSENNQNVCYRTAVAGKSLALMLATLNGSQVPYYNTPDTTQVAETYEGHPDAQCRLDTYLAGAVCGKSFPLNVIPTAVNDAACKVYGFRPRCWFAP